MKKITLFLLLFCSCSLFAQRDYGSIRGRITDEFSGDAIKYAKLSLQINEALVAQAQADENGNFLIRPVKSGTYDLLIQKMGFSPLKITGILVESNQNLEFNPSYEGEGYDQDTLTFTYAEMQPKTSNSFISTNQKRHQKRQERAARRLD